MFSTFKYTQMFRLWAMLIALIGYYTPLQAFSNGDQVYLQFPTVGRAIYVDGTTVKAGTYSEVQGKPWTLVDDSDDNDNTWRLRNAGGYFLKANDGNTGLEVTMTETEATVFTLTSFTYQSITANRYNVSYTDAYANTCYLKADYSSDTPAIYQGNNSQILPYTLIRLAATLEGPEIPVFSQDEASASDVWYPIHFLYNDRYMKDMGNGNNAQIVPWLWKVPVWKFVPSDTEGYFMLKSSEGNSLKKGTGSYYITTSTKSEASLFNLIESIDETTPLATKSNASVSRKTLLRLHRQGLGSQTLHQPFGGDGSSLIGDYNADAAGNYFVIKEELYLHFTATGPHFAYNDGSSSLQGKSYDSAEDLRYKWLYDEVSQYIISAVDGKYLKAGSGDALTLTDAVGEATKFIRTTSSYNKNTAITRFQFSTTDGKYLGCSDKGDLKMYSAGNTRYTLIASTTNGPALMPQIATADKPSTTKWYRLDFTYAYHESNAHVSSLTDADAEGGNFKLNTFSASDASNPKFYWQLVDDGSGTGDVYLKSYAGHQLAGGMGDGIAFTAGKTTDRVMRLQDYAEKAANGARIYQDKWQMLPSPDENSTFYMAAFNGSDGVLKGRRVGWEATHFRFEEISIPYPEMFNADAAGTLELKLMFYDGTTTRYLSSTSSGLSITDAAASAGLWKAIGTAEGFTLMNADGKYVQLNGTTFTLTTTASNATRFLLQPNNSVVTDRIVWSIVLADAPDKALGVSEAAVTEADACTAACSAEFVLMSKNTIIQFSANGRLLLSAPDAAGEAVVAKRVADATDRESWNIIGTNDNFVLQNIRNGCYLSKTLTLTTDISEAVALKKISNNFYHINKSDSTRCRYDLCRVDNPAQRLAIAADETGALEWTTVSSSRYTTIRISETLNGPTMFPQVSPEHPANAKDAHWYSLRFPNLNHYVTTTATVGVDDVRNQPRDATYIQELQLWRFEKTLAADGTTDRGEYVLRDIHGNYLTYNSNYCITADKTKAARMRLVDAADETGSTGGVALNTLWRLRRDGAGENNTMHPNFGGDTRDLKEYSATDAKNYMLLTEETFALPTEIFAGSRTVKFVTEGTKALYYDAANNAVKAKCREADSEDFKWTLAGDAADFTMQCGGKYLLWDGSSLGMTDAPASATHFMLSVSTYEVYPTQRYDICSADGTKVLKVTADGTLTMADYVSNRFTTVDFSDTAAPGDVSTTSRVDLFGEGKYCRIFFEDGLRRRLYFNPAKGFTLDDQDAGKADLQRNVWKFVAVDAAHGDYILQNGRGGYLKGNTLTDNSIEADIVHPVEGADEHYWRLQVKSRGYSLVKQDAGAAPAPRRIVTVGGMETGCNVSFATLTDEEARQAMMPEVSDAENGNIWYYVQHDAMALTDKGCSATAACSAPQNHFTQIWKVVAAGESGKFLLQSNSGNYLRRNETTDAGGTTVVTYTTTHVQSEATPFMFEARLGDLEHWCLQSDGTDKFLTLKADGSLSEGDDSDAAAVRFIAELWYIDRIDHKVLHRRSGIYDKQGVAADAKDEEGNPLGIDAATGLQSTNEYRVFYYVKKGESFNIESPTRRGTSFKHIVYQRWFDYNTGRCPTNGVLTLDCEWNGTKQVMGYRNGWVLGSPAALTGGYANGIATFNMPANAGETVHEGTEGVEHTVATDYTIAFEMTRYSDFSDFDNPDLDPTEASLQMRAVFEIREARQAADYLYDNCRGDTPFKTHNITFPTKVHGSNHNKTYSYEAVPLSMRADSYFCWYVDGEGNKQDYFAPGLRLELEDPDHLGITLVSETVTGADRLVKFRYPANGVLTNAHGKKIQIKVYTDDTKTAGGNTATKCYVGVFNITFEDDTEPMLYSDIVGNTTLERTPESLNAIFGEPVARLQFDDTTYGAFIRPDDGTNTANDNTYGMPLEWSQASYAYYKSGVPIASSDADVAWGEYALVRQWKYGFGGSSDGHPLFKDITAVYSDYYKEKYAADPSAYAKEYQTFCGGTEAGKADYLVYIDSSEKPGNIVELPFDGNLCPGSKMYFSAWIASGNDEDGVAPASVIFDLVGRSEDGSESLIHSFCPGQISGWYYPGDGTVVKPTGGHGFWQQVYFTFSDHSGQTFDEYLLRLRNDCVSSSGGDILIDNIKVYISRPHVEVAQSAPVCGDAVNFIKIESDFETLLSTVGIDEEPTTAETSETHDVWYCFLDKKAFDDEYAREANGTMTKEERAFNAALLGIPTSTKYGEGAYHKARFATYFESNAQAPYDFKEALKSEAISTFRRTEPNGERRLLFVDRVKDAKMQPGKEYYLVMMVGTGLNLSDFIRRGYNLLSPEGDCSVKATFEVTQAYSVKINNEDDYSDSEVHLCKGASVTLRTELSGTVDGSEKDSHGIYHDWWLDFVGGVFNDQKTTLADGSELFLSDALTGFRAYNPTAETLDGATTGPADDTHAYPFTTEMLELLKKYVNPYDDHIAPLILYRNSLTIVVPETGGNVTVLPIEPELQEEGVLYCYEPQQFSIQVEGSAPQAYVGLNGTTYPAAVDYVPIRLGLDDIATTKTTEMEIPFHTVKFAYDTGNDADFIAFIDKVDGQTYGNLRLAGTNDPRYDYDPADLTDNKNLYVVGKVTSFHVERNATGAATAKILLNDDFQPREGYYYTLRFLFGESDATTPEGNVCDGSVIIPLKIVPKYAVWGGGADDDWTNDANWLRADSTELNPGGEVLADDHPLKHYASNATNGRSMGYVPLNFTQVLLPHTVQLQEVTAGADGFLTPGPKATPYIQYDMVRNVGSFTTFYTNRCYGIVVQDGGELVRGDLLDYQKAWMEYRLACNRWYTLGTPFVTTFAGDWYVPTATGRQQSAYFSDITYNEDKNNRYKPAVYQRSWDKAEAKLYPLPGDATLSGAKPYINVAVQADWSGVFNDVEQQYDRHGMSLKVVPHEGAAFVNDEVLFRIPTEDTSYKYYKVDGSAGDLKPSITHTYRLFTDEVANGAEKVETLKNENTSNLYYLVANPFPCGLSLNRFFDANGSLEQKYWIVTANGQETAIKDDAGWNTVEATAPDVVLAPGQGFFVKAASSTNGEVSLTYNAGMMSAANSSRSILRAPQRSLPQTLRITAEHEGMRTVAVVKEMEQASDDFVEKEDLECFIDPTVDGLSFVYTLAGHQAATINSMPHIGCVPLGVQGAPDDEVTLHFSGTESFGQPLYLYDSTTAESVPLTEDFTLCVKGSTFQRYYIMTVGDAEVSERPMEITVSIEGHSISLASPCPLGSIEVYDMGGRLQYGTVTADNAHTFFLTAPGVYLIRVRGEQEKTLKVIVHP